jgi:hypothetical protein
MAITRLVGGITPADGADPRTFPSIWNATADVIEQVESDLASLDTDDVAEGANLYYTDARADARAILFAIALGG